MSDTPITHLPSLRHARQLPPARANMLLELSKLFDDLTVVAVSLAKEIGSASDEVDLSHHNYFQHLEATADHLRVAAGMFRRALALALKGEFPAQRGASAEEVKSPSQSGAEDE
ncbi:MAG TPA: hypothetical protein PKZ35_09250 [Gammaproteobacteria bacterium]|nr:hypothetical protein [Gammaproteobacteria bacterium]